MSESPHSESFLSLQNTAAQLGVPAAWLRQEARAGRVPYLRAGRRLLFHPAAVEAELLDRANMHAKEGRHEHSR